MKLVLVSIYPKNTMAKFLLSSYLLKGFIDGYHQGKDLSVDVLNFSELTGETEIAGKIIERNPDYIGYSCYVWNIEKVLSVAQTLGASGDVVHILGGPEVSLKRASSFGLPAGGYYYVVGEGEQVLLNLLDYLMQGSGKGSIDRLPEGVATYIDGELVYRENKGRIARLDDIPSVYLNGILEARLYARQQAFLETQRGCLFRCKYCVYHKNNKGISYYSLDRIYDELENLIAGKTLSALRIFDAIFTSDITRAKSIVNYLIDLKERKGVQLPSIYWEMTYDTVDDDFADLLASLKYRNNICNHKTVKAKDRPQMYSDFVRDYTAINCIGVQSLNNQSLQAVGRRRMNPERFARFMNCVNTRNLVLKVDVILGLPFETSGTYWKGLEFLLPYFRNTDHILNIHLLQILPNSDLEDLCRDYGIEFSEAAPHTVVATKHFPESEIAYTTKLSAVLSRIVNSPLREVFFSAKDSSGSEYTDMIEDVCDQIIKSERFQNTHFVTADSLDDDYWNSHVFSEIPSEWLSEVLNRLN